MSEVRVAIDAEIAELQRQAVSLIDRYWEWFTDQCRIVADAKKRGEDVKLGRLGPVVEEKKSGESRKVYLRWKDFGGQNVRRTNKSYSMPIAPSAAEDHRNQIRRTGSWEVTRAIELENQLIPIRLRIEGLHEARVRMTSAERKIERLTKE